MVLLTNDYGSLTDNILEIYEVFNDAMADEVNESFGLRLFNVRDTKTKNDRLEINHGLSWVKKIAENEDYPEATGEQGDNITLTKFKYGVDVIITKEDILYDNRDQIEDNIPSVVEEGMSGLDQSLADIVLQAYNTTYTDVRGDTVSAVWPDGLALASAVHSNGTTWSLFTNIITDGTNTNPWLGGNRDALVKTRAVWLKYSDPQGVKRRINFDTILVWPDLEDDAMRLINSEHISGSANNDTNEYLKWRIKIKVWEKLAATASWTDTSAYRQMYDSKRIKRTLKLFFSQHPKLAEPKMFDPNFNNHFLFDFLYSRGFSRAPYMMFSKWDNS